MCNKRYVEAQAAKIAKRYELSQLRKGKYLTEGLHFAFDHPTAPIITTEEPNLLQTDFHWGLVPPNWGLPKEEIWNSTYNAKIEYLEKRKSYKNITHQRCLIPTTKYLEYHWNDPKGKTKTQYEIWHSDSEIFSLAGLYSEFNDIDGSIYKSYTIITTEGNDRMRFVHNKDAAIDYHRMPLMLNPEDEKKWLDLGIPYMDFAYPKYQPRLIAGPVEGSNPPPIQTTLF